MAHLRFAKQSDILPLGITDVRNKETTFAQINMELLYLGSSIYYWGVYDFHDTALDGEKVRYIHKYISL